MSKEYNEFDLTNAQKLKLEKDTIKKLHGKKKIAHIFRYYKIQMFILLLAVLVLALIFHQIAESRYKDILYIGIVNDSVVENELMADDIKDFLGSDSRFENVKVDNSFAFTEEDKNVYEADVKLLTYAAIGKIDVVICDKSCFDLIKSEYLDEKSAVEISADNKLFRKYKIDDSDEYVACKGIGIANDKNADKFLKYIEKNNG